MRIRNRDNSSITHVAREPGQPPRERRVEERRVDDGGLQPPDVMDRAAPQPLGDAVDGLPTPDADDVGAGATAAHHPDVLRDRLAGGDQAGHTAPDSDSSAVVPTRGPSRQRGARRVEVVEFKQVALDAAGQSPALALDLPGDVQSILVEVTGNAGSYYLVDRLRDPQAKALVEPSPQGDLLPQDGPGASSNPSIAVLKGTGVLLAPNADIGALGPGRWQLGVAGYTGDDSGNQIPAQGTADVKVHIVRGARLPTRGKLDLQVHIPGIHGWSADNAAQQSYLQNMLEVVRHNLDRAGVELHSVRYKDLDPSFAEVDPLLGRPVEQLLCNGDSDTGIDVFLAQELCIEEGRIGGISGGIPGPASPGTSASGVAVRIEDPSWMSAEDVGRTLAHEICHYLGLQHTTEADGKTHDPITDTPEGPAGSENLMYWRPGRGSSTLSQGQAGVMLRHPLLV